MTCRIPNRFQRSVYLERVPKPFDLIRISVDRCNCSYVLGQTLSGSLKKIRCNFLDPSYSFVFRFGF
ncbi:hypothetical protein IQB76_01915 [Leptospira borgpetersenii serovar Hardjo-bovis]|nr:hypothetical protein LBK6_12780 [Leptospira borgpetersenii serovar Hardjo]MBE8349507.1 hypothetical protein [Leptospira borgpetersenii serovar Hardjo-bovis]AMX62402.1 hypothetical protein LBK9_12690 [Leptospira borgpetersenii serovar Hardjo]AMX65644.1 hypothetical protein LBK30_12705 [Leptospira borgpetersenii serovar Hardjo]AMX68877.1 hypothetical protein LBHA_12660 [Leptospira borgpetersenii serovar Hardjo]